MDRHSNMIAVNKPTDSRNLGFRAVCIICREGGNLAFAAFHEYPLGASILKRDASACPFSASSPLACDILTEELRARTVSVFEVSRCE